MERIRTNIMGTKIDAVSRAEALERIGRFLQSEKSRHVVTPNAEFILQARRDQEFRDILNQSDLAVLDGSGPLIASWFTSVRLKEIVPGSDLVQDILKLSQKENFRILHLNPHRSLSGSSEIETAVRERFPGSDFASLEVAPQERESKALLARIESISPAVILVGFGSPYQDIWIKKNLPKLTSPRLAMGIGGSFDFISGRRNRAPQAMQKAGLEWLHRLVSRPQGGEYYFGRRVHKIARSVVWFPLVFVFTLNKG